MAQTDAAADLRASLERALDGLDPGAPDNTAFAEKLTDFAQAWKESADHPERLDQAEEALDEWLDRQYPPSPIETEIRERLVSMQTQLTEQLGALQRQMAQLLVASRAQSAQFKQIHDRLGKLEAGAPASARGGSVSIGDISDFIDSPGLAGVYQAPHQYAVGPFVGMSLTPLADFEIDAGAATKPLPLKGKGLQDAGIDEALRRAREALYRFRLAEASSSLLGGYEHQASKESTLHLVIMKVDHQVTRSVEDVEGMTLAKKKMLGMLTPPFLGLPPRRPSPP